MPCVSELAERLVGLALELRILRCLHGDLCPLQDGLNPASGDGLAEPAGIEALKQLKEHIEG